MSAAYWDRRWRSGPPCPGSAGKVARHKAAWLNALIEERAVRSVVDWGCGDGFVAGLLDVTSYTGVDVSPAAICRAVERLGDDASFVLLRADAEVTIRADLAVSMEVLFHLTDDAEYLTYLDRLFRSARRLVAVYGTDYDSETVAHMRHRNVTRDAPNGWTLTVKADDPETPGWYLWERT